MADIFQTVKHRAGAGFDEPLHIRERSGRHASTALGHAVCLRDWAMLLEFELERMSSATAGPFTAYPHGIDTDMLGFMDHYTAVGAFMPAQAGNTEWLDPEWEPEGEWFDVARNYDLIGLHGLRLCAKTMTTRRPRSLDDLRRHYYDVKRMTRLDMWRYATVNLTGPAPGGTTCYGINPDGSRYAYDDVTGGTVAVDFSRRFHPDVVSHGSFKGTVKWVLGMFAVDGNGHRHADDHYEAYKTVWLPANGTAFSFSPCNSSACRKVLEEAMAQHPVYADDSYYCAAGIYRTYAGWPVVVCDVEFPSDSEFRGWGWRPEENQEDEG